MRQLWKDWQLFAEETGEESAPDAGEQGAEDFETLIRGRYKEAFDARVQRILDGRLRNLRQENMRLRQDAGAAAAGRRVTGGGAAAAGGGAAPQGDGLCGGADTAADGSGHRQRRQPRGGERRQTAQRQPV